MDEREPRTVLQEHQKGMGSSEALQDGGMDEIKRNCCMGSDTNSVWGRTQTGGLCVSGSEDLGGGGRRISFHGGVQTYPSFRKDSIPRCYVKDGSFSSQGRDSHPHSDAMFQSREEGCLSKDRMAGMAYSHAPLTDTRSLVSRKIVRVRAVGPRRMYDLEVSHPKHNFLLPNGVITSNSETTIHFYPSDKRKLYNANKAMRKFAVDQQVDFKALAHHINTTAKQKQYTTTPDEIAGLVAASSTVSADSQVSNIDGEPGSETMEKYADDTDKQPDVQYEQAEVHAAMHSGIATLSVLEQKVLRMRGVGA